MPLESPEKTITKIAKSTGKTPEEIQGLIHVKKAKFSGLLTESGAAFMVAKELGVEVDSRAPDTVKISKLRPGMNNIDVVCRIKAVFPEKEFEKNGRKGKLQNVVIQDDSGEIRATLWNGDVEKFQGLGLAKGEAARLSNCSVSEYNGQMQLSLNYNSSITKEESHGLPEAEQHFKKLKELEPGMKSVDVRAEVRKMFNPRNFDTQKAKGKLLTFILGDDETEIRATAWNEKADEVAKVLEDETIAIESAYTKEGMHGGVELHLGKGTRIVRQKKGKY